MTPEIKYQNYWLSVAKRALADSKMYSAAGLHDQALHTSEIGHYCMKRYEKAHLKFISAQRERAQQTAGTVFFTILLAAVIHYIITRLL